MSSNSQKRVELFGSVLCPYCYQAKAFLKRKGIEYSYREVPMFLGLKLPLPVFFEMKQRSSGQTTVPQIFIDGTYYGDEETMLKDDKTGVFEKAFLGD